MRSGPKGTGNLERVRGSLMLAREAYAA
jgi:hypothetical protein